MHAASIAIVARTRSARNGEDILRPIMEFPCANA
jgi:hypothetical protein